MTTQFTDIKLEVFASKEHYLAFRQAWKDYINSGKAKAIYEDGYNGGKVKVGSNLTSAHHFLFGILTGKDLAETFRPSVLHECKHGFHHALYRAWYFFSLAEKIVNFEENGEQPKFVKNYEDHVERDKARLAKFCEPFGEVFTPKMMVKIFEGRNQRDFTNVKPELEKAA